MLTDAAVYYQAMHAVESEPQQRWPIGDVRAVLRKRHLLRHTALEIELAPAERSRSRAAAAGADAPLEATERGARAAELAAPADGVSVAAACPSVLFAFGSEMERDAAATLLLGLRDGARARALGAADASRPTAPSVDFGAVEAASLEAAQRAWLCGALSSFDYLMAMNSLAGRSVHDLSQYPVLPWVLADYRSQSLNLADPAAFRDLSKPIGALNPARLEQFRERYRESADAAHEPPFMYGTHYSTAGFVLYYLVRQAPALMLRLQSGRFDDPQRLFHSVCATWDGVNSSTSDVKVGQRAARVRQPAAVGRRLKRRCLPAAREGVRDVAQRCLAVLLPRCCPPLHRRRFALPHPRTHARAHTLISTISNFHVCFQFPPGLRRS